MRKKILFRADGNSNSGLGHLYRIFALIEIFKREYNCTLLIRSDSTLSIIPDNYFYKIIPNHIPLEKEPHWMAKTFVPKDHVMIIDGYHFDAEYEKNIVTEKFRLIAIDDTAQVHHFADFVINHSPNFTPKSFKSESYTKFGLGPKYAILRPSFLKTAKEPKSKINKNIAFICYGGADPKNFTLKTTLALIKINQINEINIVLGNAYEHSTSHLKHKKTNILSNLSADELVKIMRNSDIGFVSSSTILYEAITTKLIVFTGYFIDNQIGFYNALKKKKVFYGLDNMDKLNFHTIIGMYQKIEIDTIKKHIENQQKLIDGKSKIRFLQIMEQLT